MISTDRPYDRHIKPTPIGLDRTPSREQIAEMLAKVRAGYWRSNLPITVEAAEALLVLSLRAHDLDAMVNNPHTDEFLPAVKLEAAHQRDRWGDAHGRGKSAEHWFWVVEAQHHHLRAVISGENALHHIISSAAALANWYEAIKRDTTGTGLGQDNDIKPVEIARFEDWIERFGDDGTSIDTSDREVA